MAGLRLLCCKFAGASVEELKMLPEELRATKNTTKLLVAGLVVMHAFGDFDAKHHPEGDNIIRRSQDASHFRTANSAAKR